MIENNIRNLENKLFIKGCFCDKSKLDDYYEIGEMIELDIMRLMYNYYTEMDLKIKEKYGKSISVPNIEKIHQFYLIIKNGVPLNYDLTWGHYKELIKLHDLDLINYYLDIAVEEELSVKDLHHLLQREAFSNTKCI